MKFSEVKPALEEGKKVKLSKWKMLTGTRDRTVC